MMKNQQENQKDLNTYLGEKYKTTDEIIKDPVFVEILTKTIDKIKTERRKRKPAPQGYKYLRTAIDRLMDESQLTPKYFLSHIEAIWFKESDLPTVIREFIYSVCSKALTATLEFHAAKEVKNGK
jgi:hypothetical protein